VSGNDLILVGAARQLDPTNESGLWVREPPLARLTAAVMRLTGLDTVRELRRDRFGLIRNVVAAGAHLENDVRHRLQDMLVESPAWTNERRPIFTSDSSPRWCLEHPEPQRGHVDAVVEGDGFHGVQLRWVRWREQDGPQSCGGQRRRVRVAARHFAPDPHREGIRPKSGSGEDERGVA